MTGLMFPKPEKKKKKKKHKPSIIQYREDKRCLLCMILNNDFTVKMVEEHHVIFGSGKRSISEEHGLKANLCICHHRVGENAVHNNKETADLLRRIVQEKFEEQHTHDTWMKLVHKNYL